MAFNDTINTGTTPNDGQGDGLRTNIRKLHDNTKDNKQRLDNLNGNTPGVVSVNNTTILSPLDGSKSFASSITGSIAIELPHVGEFSMIKLFIEVFDYRLNKSVSIIVSGYVTTIPNPWSNVTVVTIASDSLSDYTLRFGMNSNNKPVIYIGELNYFWSYLGVNVTKIIIKNGGFNAVNWLTGWNLYIETSSFQNVTATHTNNLPVAQ